MKPIEKVRSYAHRYQKGAAIIYCGWGKWEVSGAKEQKANIAKKAIMEGMHVGTTDVINQYGERVREMYITY